MQNGKASMVRQISQSYMQIYYSVLNKNFPKENANSEI